LKFALTFFVLLNASIITGKDLLVVSTLQLYPWSYTEQGVIKGAFYEPIELIRKQYSGKIKHLITPLTRSLAGMTKTNAYDLALFTPGPHSAQLIDLGVVLDGIMLIALPRKGIIIHSIDDFKTLRIGAPRGISANTPVIDNSLYDVSFSNDNIFGLRMLEKNRIDVYVETNVSISSVAEALKLAPENYEKPVILIQGKVFHAHLWLNKKSTISDNQRTEIERLVKEMKITGKFEHFVDDRLKWLEQIPD